MRPIITGILLLLVINTCWSQKSVSTQHLVWYTYLQNLQLNNRLTLQTDIQERHFIVPLKQSQFVVRATLKTLVGSNWDIGPGFCVFVTNTYPGTDYDLQVPELRPYLEINNKQQAKIVTVYHRYRLEARFLQNTKGAGLAEGFSFNSMRFRYQLGADFPLYKPKTEKHALKLRLIDELMLNFGGKVRYNLFDQNRLQGALQYAPIPALAIEAGYIHWFQQRASGDAYFNRHILRVGLVHNLKLKRNKEKPEGNS
jgi:Protein of unknown function (DUF2490)